MKEKLYTKQDVKKLQARDYGTQINVAYAKIQEAFMMSNYKIFVAFSGGKDSTCLLYMASYVWKTLAEYHHNAPLEVVFNDTTIEYAGMKKFVLEYVGYIESLFDIKINLHITRPKNNMNFVKVYREVGIPLISKQVAKSIRTCKDIMNKYNIPYSVILEHKEPTLENVSYLQSISGGSKTFTLNILGYTSGIQKFGSQYKIPEKWMPLLNAPFDLTDKCCSILKHSNVPEELKDYSVMTGEMAEESEQRMKSYQTTGCNAFVSGKGKSKPFGPITLQTELHYLKDQKIPLFKYYGTIEEYEGKYETTGMYRTGCALCGFGLEFEPDRFQRLYALEPARVKFAFKPRSEGVWDTKKHLNTVINIVEQSGLFQKRCYNDN